MGAFDFFKRDRTKATDGLGSRTTIYRPPRQVMMRGIDALTGGRLFGSWHTNDRLNDQLINGLETIRGRARDLEINNDYIRKYLNNLKVNVVGPQGIVLQCQFRDKNNQLKSELNNKIERHFRDWSRKGFCEVTGRFSWPELQRMILSGVARDGEVFLRFVYLDHGFSLQLIDPALVPEGLNVRGKDSKNIRMGIETNLWGRPEAYYLQAKDDAPNIVKVGGRPYFRVPASEMLHIFKSDRADSIRGLSWLASVMLRLKMLAGMEEANLVAARVGSANMGFFTRPLEEGDGRLRDELSFSDHGTDLIDSAEPGSFRELPPGYDFKSFDPKVPQDSFAPFVKSMLRAVSSGLPAGSYNSIANDRESTSYSSLRHAWLDETDAYKELQSWLIDSLNRPVYQAWLKSLYLSGKLNISAVEMNECLEPQFVPRRWGFIDPLKQTRSDIESLAAGIKSKSEVVSDNGKSYDDLAHELKIEKEIDKSLGLSPVEIKPSGGD